MRSRTPLLVLVPIVLAPVPVVAWLGGSSLDRLERAAEELQAEQARTELARELSSRYSTENVEAGLRWVPLQPSADDPGSIEWTPAPSWFDHPARIEFRRFARNGEVEAALEALTPVFTDDDVGVRSGARLDAASQLSGEDTLEHAESLARQARELAIGEPALARWRDLRADGVLAEAGSLDAVEAWLAEVEARSTDLRELALLGDVLQHRPETGLLPRLEERHRWPGRRERLRARLLGSEARWLAFLDEHETIVAERKGSGSWWMCLAPELGTWLEEWSSSAGVQLQPAADDSSHAPAPLPLDVALRGARAPGGLDLPAPGAGGLDPRLTLYTGLGIYGLLGLWTLAAASAHQRQARRLAETRGDLIAQVAHELRTPLTVIRMYADTLRSGRAPEGAHDEYLRTVQEESQRLAALVDRVAEAARSAEEPDVQRGPIDPEVCLDPVISGIQAHRAQRAEPFDVQRSARSDLRVVAEPEEVRRVVEILVDNAVRYCPEDLPLELRTGVDGRRWTFELRDHGPGIPPEERERIFERWVRGKAATSSGHRGAGMGLWLARRTAEELGGTLRLEFPPEGGTRARLELPLSAEGDRS